jgi:hypothetical protein
MNPDGMLKSQPTRTNANGVDLNRNFPTPHWDKEAPRYWQQRTSNDPRRYPGHQALVRARDPLAARRDGALEATFDRGRACALWRARF